MVDEDKKIKQENKINKEKKEKIRIKRKENEEGTREKMKEKRRKKKEKIIIDPLKTAAAKITVFRHGLRGRPR